MGSDGCEQGYETFGKIHRVLQSELGPLASRARGVRAKY
jgi:hypothetical protein